MNLLRSGWLLGLLAATAAGCSSGADPNSKEFPAPDATAYTVSYRNKVRLPDNGATLDAAQFAAQTSPTSVRDPIKSIRCLGEDSPAYADVTKFLGGLAWTHPVSIIKDSSYPVLFDSKWTAPTPSDERSASAGGDGNSSAAAVVIERPDLVGIQNGIAIFLSKEHGLLAVDATKAAAGILPEVGCSMKLPGDPKNFLFHGNELVVVVNGRGAQSNHSALIRYSFDANKFHFKDAVHLDNQTIQDARLFNSTIVAYTSWTKPDATPAPFNTNPTPSPTTGGGGAGGSGNFGGESRGAPMGGSYNGGREHLGTKVIVVQWDEALKVDYEDALLDDKPKQDPLEGTDPNKKYVAGDVVYEQKTFKTFVAASDRYVVVPRDVRRTIFRAYQTETYQICTNYNPQYTQVEQCSVSYEQKPNPDYKAPNATGDYQCNGKTLADCVTEAAPTVSQYVYVPTGQTCTQVWIGRCEKYEPKTVTYPVFDNEDATEMTIYRFENDSFTKLDSTLAKLIDKPGANTDVITFENNPLAVKGSISNRNQIQFQNGHLYVFADQALQTMAVAGNSISYLNRLNITANTTNNPSIAFSADRAMISARNYQNSSDVAMLDLTTPSFPKSINAFTMPGTSSQLILAGSGILGPGDVKFSYANVSRDLQKVTLFSKADGSELDNLLLGTEYDTMESSWFDGADDQRLRLSTTTTSATNNTTRLFFPYSGRHHADAHEPIAHRLNISRIENNRLVSEHSFAVSDDIIRTTEIDENRSLAFANSAAYFVDHTSGDWALSILRELFVPFATYRFSDNNDLHARLSRVGSKCRVTTISTDAKIFDESEGARLAQADVACQDNSFPVAIGRNIIFAETATGVRISEDGRTIDQLTQADTIELVKLIPKNKHCYIADAPPKPQGNNGALVSFLDAVPTKIICENDEVAK